VPPPSDDPLAARLRPGNRRATTRAQRIQSRRRPSRRQPPFRRLSIAASGRRADVRVAASALLAAVLHRRSPSRSRYRLRPDSGTAAVISRTGGALLLSPAKANVAPLRHRTLAADEQRAPRGAVGSRLLRWRSDSAASWSLAPALAWSRHSAPSRPPRGREGQLTAASRDKQPGVRGDVDVLPHGAERSR
jgi:hypothetical protein